MDLVKYYVKMTILSFLKKKRKKKKEKISIDFLKSLNSFNSLIIIKGRVLRTLPKRKRQEKWKTCRFPVTFLSFYVLERNYHLIDFHFVSKSTKFRQGKFGKPVTFRSFYALEHS